MTQTTVRTDFAGRLYNQLAATQAGKNLFLSPFSIQVALAMCAAGAKGETRKVLADLIGAPENVDEQNRQYAQWLKSLTSYDERPFQLSLANAVWGQQGFHFVPQYQKAIAECYDGVFKEVNFQTLPDEAVKMINAWVSDKTAGKIKELIQRNLIDQQTRLILTNAIYFKGKWDGEFNKKSTKDEDWHGPGGRRKVPMMHQKRGYLHFENDDLQALELPYQGEQLSMLIVLPKQTDGLAVLESKWADDDVYGQVTNNLYHEDTVILTLPRFKVESAFKLKPVLSGMGAEQIFSDAADFSGIANERTTIAEVVHKAFVEVNEEGTEAAAATGVVMTKCAVVEPSQPVIFKADHPFLFFIRDTSSHAVMFAGRVLEP